MTEIVQGIKGRVGPDFPVQVRMNAIEIGAGDEGFNIEEAKELAVTLHLRGACRSNARRTQGG